MAFDSSFDSLDGLSEEAQIAAVRRNGARIQTIKAPSDAVKLAAVSGDMAALALQHIKDPGPELCRVAVEHNGHAIKVVPSSSAAAIYGTSPFVGTER